MQKEYYSILQEESEAIQAVWNDETLTAEEKS
jgi:hypothetical protein